MLWNLFEKQGDGTEMCPRCKALIVEGQYVRYVNGVSHHIYCSSRALEDERNEWGFPQTIQTDN